jgi:hypothetical protein
MARRRLVGAMALVALGVAILVGGTSAPPGPAGFWFAEMRAGGRDGPVVQEIVERRGDGRLRIATRVLEGCRPRSLEVREGRWWPEEAGRLVQQVERIEGDSATAAPPLPPRPQRHDIALLRADRLGLRDEGGTAREALRVTVDFEFPPPAGCPDPHQP